MFFLLYFLLSTFFSNLTSLNTKSQTLHVGNPLQCSCLENPRDREAWWAAVYGVAQSRTRLKRLSSSSSSCSMFKQLHIRIVCACSISQSCPALCNSIDCSLWGSSVHGILQVLLILFSMNSIFSLYLKHPLITATQMHFPFPEFPCCSGPLSCALILWILKNILFICASS